jgi:hypothetical protein
MEAIYVRLNDMSDIADIFSIEGMEEIKGAVVLDGLNKAIIGTARTFGKDSVLAYDYNKIINILIERDKMNPGEAIDFFEYNIVGMHVNSRNPVFIDSDALSLKDDYGVK